MASVTKDSRGRSPFWVACYSDAMGRRMKKTTKTKNRDVAMRMAMQLERAARLGASGELTEHRSRELLSELLESITDGRESVRVVTAKKFLGDWLDTKRALLAKGSIWSYESSIESMLAHLGDRADRPLAAIQPQDVQGFVHKLQREGLAPRTIGVYLKVIRSALRTANLQQLLTFNPAAAVEIPRGESVSKGVFTPAEVALLLQAAPTDDWRTVILLGAYTGQRLRDCASVQWADVDFTAGTVTFRVSKKGGRKLMVPMHPDLRAHLEKIAGDAPEKYLATSLAERETGGTTGLSEQFKRVMKAAGVEAGEGENAGTRKMTARSFHSLRHGFVSALANLGVGEDVRMKLAGHTTKAVHAGYTHHELDALASAVARLPGIATKKPE